MEIRWRVVVLDADDIGAESAFWAGVLGGTVDAEDDWHMVMRGSEPVLGVQRVPGHRPPDWPDGEVPQQVHQDLWVDDPAAAHAEVLRLGARVLQPTVAEDGASFRVYADPAGHPFCLCWVTARDEEPSPGTAD